MAFEDSVFINCPFDTEYKRLLHPMIFTCIYCGLVPKLASLNDSGSTRIRQLIELIRSSKYSIHDLSRMKSKKANELARFNMPFELGLDLGTRTPDDLMLSSKRCLILDIEKYRYQAALSDLGGSDIYSYGTKNQAENLIKSLRTWFTDSLNPVQPPAGKIYLEYTEFVSDLQILLKSEGFSQKDIRNLTNSEYTHYANAWIQARPTTTST